MKADGVDMTVAPPASARVHSPCRSAWQARCSATSDDEQAVSTVTAGPSMPSAYEIRLLEQPHVVLAGGAGEHPHLVAAQRRGVDPGVLERLPGGLQQQPLLGVHGDRLAGRDAEERGVELGGRVDEAALGDVRRAGVVGVRVVQPRQVPAAVGGERGDGVASGVDQLPQFLGRAHPAGEPAGHADDGDRLAAGRLKLAEFLPGLVKVRRHPFQVLPERIFSRH
jgi:hypothetical protein